MTEPWPGRRHKTRKRSARTTAAEALADHGTPSRRSQDLLAVLESYPRLREFLEHQIGPIGAGLALSVGNAVVYGLSDGTAKPAVDACHQLLAAEVRARRDLWSRRGPELCQRDGELPAEVAPEVGTEGRLGGQARVPGVGGTWRDLTDSVNFMAGNLTSQVRDVARVATAVAGG